MEKKYIPSVFNYIVRDPGKTILFNSYVEKILCSEECRSIDDLLNGEENADKVLKEKLITNGFLVQETEDEWAKGKLKYYDRIFNRVLALTFLTTEQCNFRCKYCYEEFKKGKMKDEVINGVIKRRCLPGFATWNSMVTS